LGDRQEDHEFESNLGCLVRPCLNKTNRKKNISTMLAILEDSHSVLSLDEINLISFFLSPKIITIFSEFNKKYQDLEGNNSSEVTQYQL
jgi:hypothetical protein